MGFGSRSIRVGRAAPTVCSEPSARSCTLLRRLVVISASKCIWHWNIWCDSVWDNYHCCVDITLGSDLGVDIIVGIGLGVDILVGIAVLRRYSLVVGLGVDILFHRSACANVEH